ncbi:MAG: transglycosylase SLT domain-containing protein [Bacteroidales bacterium]|nr:transglycosylase SLT domain-containing protein [Bacteroidales bacterium]
MKRIKTILVALAAGFFTASAQNNDTEITVHNDQTGRDEVIDLPEGMTQSCDSLLSEWMAKKYLYPDTTCVDPDTNPVFQPDEFRDRLRRLPVVMEMPYNSVVQKFIDQYSTRLRRSVSYMLGAGNFYVPIFEEALDYYGLPLELKYLPFIESALEPKAKSRAGAVGLWQFMLATAKRYDLTVNSLIDERQDPYKATWAAARYLRDLYGIFNDWNLVIAAYNCGPTNVSKAIHRAGGLHDYWSIYPYLPAETRGYVPAFIAANYIMNYYCEHNICPMKTKYPLSTDTLQIHRDLHMDQVAAFTGIDKEAIQALNPQYRTDLIPGSTGTMSLCLPTDALTAFIDQEDSIYNYRADELLKRRDVVEVTDQAASSRRTYISASSSRSSKSSRSGSSRSKRKAKSKAATKTTTVRQGDTLSQIAARNGTTVKKLRQLNGIKGNLINVGQKIRVK